MFGEMFSLQEAEGFNIESMYLIFGEDGSYISFGSQCNEQSGSIEVTDDTIYFTWESGTEMECPSGDNQTDRWLSHSLNPRQAIALMARY